MALPALTAIAPRADSAGGRVPYNTCEGAGAALHVATHEARVNVKRLTPDLLRRMCLGDLSQHTGHT